MHETSLISNLRRNLNEIMAQRQLNAKAIGEAAGLNGGGVYDIMNGRSCAPRLDTVEKIALGHGVPALELLAPQVGTTRRKKRCGAKVSSPAKPEDSALVRHDGQIREQLDTVIDVLSIDQQAKLLAIISVVFGRDPCASKP